MPTQLTRAELRRVAAQRPTTVTIGVFDGVHRGHVALLRRVIERAAANGSAAGVVTFHPHPQHVLRPRHAAQLPHQPGGPPEPC